MVDNGRGEGFPGNRWAPLWFLQRIQRLVIPRRDGVALQSMPGRRQFTHLDEIQSLVGACLHRITLLCSASAGGRLQRLCISLLACVDQILPTALREQIERLLQLALGDQTATRGLWRSFLGKSKKSVQDRVTRNSSFAA